MKIISEAGSVDVINLNIKYPNDWNEYAMNYETASSSGSNEVYKIYAKAYEIFPRMQGMQGGRNNVRRGRRIRRLIRSRRKAKRVKRTKSMKRYNHRRQ